MTRYCVIGAGAAGMSALVQLLEGGFEVDCFEKADRVGGHWNHDYDALHLITSRDMTHFEGFPMPADYPHFPSREQIVAYFESYAEAKGLYEKITFNTGVKSVEPIATDGPVGSTGWEVTLESGERREYDGVFIANGHLWDQKVPSFPGEYTGKQIHSGSYKNTDELAGQRVLVVGAGNSACDLAVDAAQHRFDVDIVIRQGTHFQSKTYFGVPRQEVPWLSEFAPDEVDLLSRLLSRAKLGEWYNFPGLPEPKERTLAEGRAVVNDLLLYWVHHGRIRIVPGIERFDGKTVYFTDGTSGEYDTILWGTGFHASLPFLDESLIERSRQVPLRYGAGIVPKGLEKLYYIGLSAPRGPQVPIYGIQMKRAIRMIQLHEASETGFVPVQDYLSKLQDADDRIDFARHFWEDQLADTDRLLEAFASLARTNLATV
ncbi:MAG: flavin-containing monooxygenase [Gulosibacter sp.]|uniref:flavin-containing monooxygenase n=1 Tax=Gulosibacter sp. TaxID=2817531 RepID=UPI003F9100DC